MKNNFEVSHFDHQEAVNLLLANKGISKQEAVEATAKITEKNVQESIQRICLLATTQKENKPLRTAINNYLNKGK